jgi:probable F420-dependent oxidoreductase
LTLIETIDNEDDLKFPTRREGKSMQQTFGVKLPGLVPAWAPSYREIPDLVVEFERMGFDNVMDGEHILFSPAMDHPGGAGDMVHGRDTHHSDRADTIVTFSAIAAKTTTIKFISGILLPPAHGFAVLARQAATLDVISDGRFIMGVGRGWNAAEFEAQGIPPRERDARAEDVVRACLQLWRPGLASYDGRWIHFNKVLCEPAPVTPGGPPVWWGGNALRGNTAARVAEFCQGWLSREAADYDEIARSIESIRHECVISSRDPADVRFRCSLTPTGWSVPESADGLIDGAVARAHRLAGLGITDFTIPLNYYRVGLDVLGRLLQALRAA